MKFWGKTIWRNYDKRAKSKRGGYQSIRKEGMGDGGTPNEHMCEQRGGTSKGWS